MRRGSSRGGPRRALVTGATGFIGGRLAAAMAEQGWVVRCLVRDPSRAQRLRECGLELHRGDVLDPETLSGVGEGVDAAYYLVHAMGRQGGGDFEELEGRAAWNFAHMAKREGIDRVIYLGGLGDRPRSKHLLSRHRTAQILAEHGPPLTYFRAGMVVGAGSESYRTLRYLVQRLPAMIAPAWLATPTQPIGIDDVVSYLARAPDIPASEGREVQIGGPDVLSYGEMLDRMAEALGLRRRPRLPVPLLTPWLSSLWIGLVTPVDAGVARPLIEGLSTPTTVTDPSGGALFGIEPSPFMEALRRALTEDPEAPATPRRRAARLVRRFEHESFAVRPARVTLLPDVRERASPGGSVQSIQEAELAFPGIATTEILDGDFLESAARAYWRFLGRKSFGFVRVTRVGDCRTIVLLARPIALLRFRPGSDEVGKNRRCVTWPIEGGLLVSGRGREKGYLRMSLERGDDRLARSASIRMRMEVRNYHPWLGGSGRFARAGAWLYAKTQLRIHRLVTRGFIRSLAVADASPVRS